MSLEDSTHPALATVKRSHLVRFRMDPRCSVRSTETLVGFVVVGDALLFAIPLQRSPQFHRQIRHDAARAGDVPLFDIRDRSAARFSGFEQVQHMTADGRGDVLFQILLGLVLGILFEFVCDIAMDRCPTVRQEVVAVDAALERPLVAIDCRALRVLRIG